MPALDWLCHIAGIDSHQFSKEENLLLEIELFFRLCNQLKELFSTQFKEYFQLIRMNTEMENIIMEANFMRCIVNDILLSEAYTLSGIALYTQMPEDIIYEVAAGCNTSPSFYLSRKIIELHRSVRPELYKEMMKKITQGFVKEEQCVVK
jgi:hypothetical protein